MKTLPRPLVLVGCSSNKEKGAVNAEDLYTGELFKLGRKFGNGLLFGSTWAILSAKYGVLHPNRLVPPYDECLDTVEKRRTWNALVLEQLQGDYPNAVQRFVPPAPEPARIIVLAGANYRGWIPDAPRHWEIIVPLAGMGIGEQKAALGRMNDSLDRSKHAWPIPDFEERLYRALYAALKTERKAA